MTQKKHPAAAGLGKEGAALVAALVADMADNDLMPDAKDTALIAHAGRLADRIGSLERAVAAEGEFVTSSTGVTRMHPAIPEIRSTVVAISQVLSKVQLSDAARPKDRKAQAAASARWGRLHA